MKKYLLLISLSALAMTVSAQNKLTPPTLLRAQEYIEQVKLHGVIGPSINSDESVPTDEKVAVFIKLNPEYSVEDLRSVEYLTIDSELSTCIIAYIPLSKLMDLNNVECIRRVELSQKLNIDMNYARPSGNVDEVQSGFNYEGSELSFDGSGVIVGMMDTGFQASHLNFQGDSATRIQRLWWMNSNDGSCIEYTPSNISSFTTDKESESHATHVAGIMGGSYKGKGTYSYMSTANGTSPSMMTNQPIPYYGVATGSDLALAVGELYTDNILKGVRNVVEYAESVGKPAVVNLSLGHTYGPHDGTDTYSDELSDLGQRAIICMSAGNDGDSKISVTKKITSASADASALRTFVQGNTTSGIITGIADLWGTDNTVLTVQWGVYSMSSKTFTPFFTIDRVYQSVSTSGVAAFSNNFTGSIKATSYIDPSNNRYEVFTEFNSVSATNTDKAIALYVTGAKDDQTLYLYSSSAANLTFSHKPTQSASIVTGYSDGSASNSINSGVCGKNIISVGAYVSRTTNGVLQSGYYMPPYSGYSVGSIAPFSSYGKAFDGTAHPLVCAPGSRIVSSYSRYYVNTKNKANEMVGSAKNGVFYSDYWGQMQGTSMSCPFVTGTIGLWLQADPTLNFERVLDVINNTSTFNSLTMRGGRWGAGKIDALEGIKYVLANKAAVGEVWADDNQRLIVTDNGSGYEVFVADGGQLTATIYDLQGRPVAQALGEDGTATIDCGALSSGIYILEARSDSYRLTRKVTRR